MSNQGDIGKTSWYEKLSVLRRVFAIFGILIMLFTGGCALVLLPIYGMSDVGIVAYFAGIPFLLGLLIWWLAAKAWRNQ